MQFGLSNVIHWISNVRSCFFNFVSPFSVCINKSPFAIKHKSNER